MKTKLKEGGWMHYLHSIRKALQRELTTYEIKNMMKLYINAVSSDDAIKSLKEG